MHTYAIALLFLIDLAINILDLTFAPDAETSTDQYRDLDRDLGRPTPSFLQVPADKDLKCAFTSALRSWMTLTLSYYAVLRIWRSVTKDVVPTFGFLLLGTTFTSLVIALCTSEPDLCMTHHILEATKFTFTVLATFWLFATFYDLVTSAIYPDQLCSLVTLYFLMFTTHFGANVFKQWRQGERVVITGRILPFWQQFWCWDNQTQNCSETETI